MKFKNVLGIALSAMMFITSCKKDSGPGEVVTPGTGAKKVSAKVDGAAFKATSTAALVGGTPVSFTITATDGNERTIIIAAPAKQGTFSSTTNSETAGTWIDQNGGLFMSTFGSSTATVTVTKFDAAAKKISGTFSFTADAVGTSGAEGSKTVTEGTFTDVPYIQ